MLLRRVVPALVRAGELLDLLLDCALVGFDGQALESDVVDLRSGNIGQRFKANRNLGILARLITLFQLDLRLECGADVLLRKGCTPSCTAPFSASPCRLSPCILRMRFGGTFPGRKPGMRSAEASRFTS